MGDSALAVKVSEHGSLTVSVDITSLVGITTRAEPVATFAPGVQLAMPATAHTSTMDVAPRAVASPCGIALGKKIEVSHKIAAARFILVRPQLFKRYAHIISGRVDDGRRILDVCAGLGPKRNRERIVAG